MDLLVEVFQVHITSRSYFVHFPRGVLVDVAFIHWESQADASDELSRTVVVDNLVEVLEDSLIDDEDPTVSLQAIVPELTIDSIRKNSFLVNLRILVV